MEGVKLMEQSLNDTFWPDTRVRVCGLLRTTHTMAQANYSK